MSYRRPTLTELDARISADLDARFPGAESRLRRSFLSVLARAVAGLAHGLYGYVDFLSRQILEDTAEGEYLERKAAIRGLARKPAAAAAGVVRMTGSDAAVCPAGTRLQRRDGTLFETVARAEIAAGQALAPVAAVEPGRAGDTATGQTLSFVSPLAGLNAVATVTAAIGGGADAEDDEALRSRLLDRIRRPPLGGAEADYAQWTLEVPGVTRAWIYPAWMGAGTVGVTFVMDGRADPIPGPADVAAVSAALEARRPVTATVVVFAPTPEPFDVTVQALSPSTPEVKAAVEAEIRDLLFRDAEPGGTVLVSRLREAISTAPGEADHRLVSPAADVVMEPGSLAVPGVLTWT